MEKFTEIPKNVSKHFFRFTVFLALVGLGVGSYQLLSSDETLSDKQKIEQIDDGRSKIAQLLKGDEELEGEEPIDLEKLERIKKEVLSKSGVFKRALAFAEKAPRHSNAELPVLESETETGKMTDFEGWIESNNMILSDGVHIMAKSIPGKGTVMRFVDSEGNILFEFSGREFLEFIDKFQQNKEAISKASDTKELIFEKGGKKLIIKEGYLEIDGIEVTFDMSTFVGDGHLDGSKSFASDGTHGVMNEDSSVRFVLEGATYIEPRASEDGKRGFSTEGSVGVVDSDGNILFEVEGAFMIFYSDVNGTRMFQTTTSSGLVNSEGEVLIELEGASSIGILADENSARSFTNMSSNSIGLLDSYGNIIAEIEGATWVERFYYVNDQMKFRTENGVTGTMDQNGNITWNE